MFDRAAFARRLDVDLAQGAEALIAEATVFGRSAMGERVERGIFRDRWRVSVAGRLVHAEEFAVGRRYMPRLAGRAVARRRDGHGDGAAVSRTTPTAGSTRCARSSATRAAPAHGASAGLASFLRGFTLATATAEKAARAAARACSTDRQACRNAGHFRE